MEKYKKYVDIHVRESSDPDSHTEGEDLQGQGFCQKIIVDHKIKLVTIIFRGGSKKEYSGFNYILDEQPI